MGCEQVNAHTQQFFEFVLQAPQVEQRRTGQCIHQQIKVAALVVVAVQHRAKDARVRGPAATGRFADGGAFLIQCA